jgi:ribonuclease E
VLFGIAQEKLRGRMFPDVRLMIAAVMASVVALVCGFGVFAAFRVNHEPLSRLSSVTAQSQLVADNAAPRTAGLAAGEPFGPRFKVSAALIANAATGLPASKPDRRDSAAPPSAVAPAAADGDAPQPPAVVAPAAQPEPSATQDAATDATSEPPSQSPTQSPTTTSSIAAVDPPADQAPAAAQAPEQAKPEAASLPDQAPPVKQASQETKREAAPPADQAPPVEQASRVPEPEAAATAEAAPVDKVGQKSARRTVARQRVAAKVRWARRSRAGAIASSTDNSAFPQPTIQTVQPAPPRFAARPAPPAVKRHRIAKRTPVRQSAVGGPFVAPPTH